MKDQCRPAPARFPYVEHRNMRQVALDEYNRRPRRLHLLTFPQWYDITYG